MPTASGLRCGTCSVAPEALYQLFFYVPESHLDAVKAAIFATGAGRIGNYDQCCWQVKGQGQFRPLAGARPHLGVVGTVEQVDEYRVELILPGDQVAAALAAMKRAHPYEVIAHGVIRLENS